MGQNATKEGIPSRRSNAFNSLTPRAEVITVGANSKAMSMESTSTKQSINRVNSSNSREFGSHYQHQTQVQNVVVENPYMIQPPVQTNPFVLKPILRKPAPNTPEMSSP